MTAIITRARVVRVNDPVLFRNLGVRPKVVLPFDHPVEQIFAPETVRHPVRYVARRIESNDLARMADHDPVRRGSDTDIFQQVAGRTGCPNGVN